MTCYRLEEANTPSANRTLELSKFSRKVSMSGAERTSNMTQSKSSKELEERQAAFRGGL